MRNTGAPLKSALWEAANTLRGSAVDRTDWKTGRCAILYPHGVLFRNEEAEMRRKLVESDLVECVLGPGLFYNSPMDALVDMLQEVLDNGED